MAKSSTDPQEEGELDPDETEQTAGPRERMDDPTPSPGQDQGQGHVGPDVSNPNGNTSPMSMADALPPCSSPNWKLFRTTEEISSGFDLPEPPTVVSYGSTLKDGRAALPQCPHFVGDVSIPVLLVDFADFEPTRDPNHSYGGADGELIHTTYRRKSPQEIEAYFNGPTGPAALFKESSMGLVKPRFKAYGWIQGSRAGAHLKPASAYVARSAEGVWSCPKRITLVLDAVRDAIAFHGLRLDSHDGNRNKVLDGVVVMLEGYHTCASPVASIVSASFDAQSATLNFIRGNTVVTSDDPNYDKFRDQTTAINRYALFYESRLPSGDFPTQTAHELGHMLLGLPDYYHLYPWSLTSGKLPSHMAAWEKSLYGRWFEPNVITQSSTVTIDANETPDGTPYRRINRYLYKIVIDNDDRHFLTVENRWFDDAGNHASSFAKSLWRRESGLVIHEFQLDKAQLGTAKSDQARFHPPSRPGSTEPQLAAYRAGDRFEKCFRTQCITIEPLGGPGAAVQAKVAIAPR